MLEQLNPALTLLSSKFLKHHVLKKRVKKGRISFDLENSYSQQKGDRRVPFFIQPFKKKGLNITTFHSQFLYEFLLPHLFLS